MHTNDSVHQTRKLTYVIGHVNTLLHIWKSKCEGSYVGIVVQLLSHVWLFAASELQHTTLPCPSLPPGVCSNSCALSQWCYLTILSSVTPLSSCPQSFSALGSFPVSWFFASGGQSIGASASASVLPVNIQGWFPFRLTVSIFLFANVFILWDCTVHWGRGYVWFPGPHCILVLSLVPFPRWALGKYSRNKYTFVHFFLYHPSDLVTPDHSPLKVWLKWSLPLVEKLAAGTCLWCWHFMSVPLWVLGSPFLPTDEPLGTPRAHVPTLNVLHQWCWHKLIEKRPHLKRVWPLPLLEFQKGPRKQSLFMEALLQNFQRCIFQLPNLILRNGWIPKLAFSFSQLRRLSQMLGGWSVYKSLPSPGESSLSGPLPWE